MNIVIALWSDCGQLQYIYLGLARTLYIRCIHGIFGREITKYMVVYGVYIRFWPTLHIFIFILRVCVGLLK